MGILPLLSINPLLTLRAHAKEYPPWVSVVVCDVCKCRRSKGRRFAVRLRTSLRHPIPYPLCSWFSPHERGVSSRLAFDCIFSSFSCLRFVTGLPAQCHRAVGSMSSCCHPSRVAWRVRRGPPRESLFRVCRRRHTMRFATFGIGNRGQLLASLLRRARRIDVRSLGPRASRPHLTECRRARPRGMNLSPRQIFTCLRLKAISYSMSLTPGSSEAASFRSSVISLATIAPRTQAPSARCF